MISCPLKDSKWKNFVSYFKEKGLDERLAELEAYRDFLGLGGELRDPEIAYADYQQRRNGIEPKKALEQERQELLDYIKDGDDSVSSVLMSIGIGTRYDDLTGQSLLTGDVSEDVFSSISNVTKELRKQHIANQIKNLRNKHLGQMVHSGQYSGCFRVTNNTEISYVTNVRIPMDVVEDKFFRQCQANNIDLSVFEIIRTNRSIFLKPKTISNEQLLASARSVVGMTSIYSDEAYNELESLNKVEPQNNEEISQRISEPIKYNPYTNRTELFSSEIEALVPNSIKPLYTTSDRMFIESEMQKIQEKFGVTFVHVKESTSNEKPRYFCNDKDFIDFILMYSQNIGGVMNANKREWDIYKSMVTNTLIGDTTKADVDFLKDSIEELKSYRRNLIKYFRSDLTINPEEEDAIIQLFEDPILLNHNNNEDNINEHYAKELKLLIEEIASLQKKNSTIIDIYENSSNLNIDHIQSDDNETLTNEALCKHLSEGLGIEYAIISISEAEEILQGSKTPFDKNNDSAFFFDGKVYFIQGRLSNNLILHEFSHPLIRAIAVKNRSLFNNLYKSLKNSREGSELIKKIHESYPELDMNSDEFIEECLVTGIELDVKTGNEKSEWFKDFIKRVIYAIKNVLREISSSRDISKLDTHTTLHQLRNMLAEDAKFDIDKKSVTRKDIAMFKRKLDLRLKAESAGMFTDVDQYGAALNPTREQINKLDQNMNTIYDFLKTYKSMISNNPDLISLKRNAIDEFGYTEFMKVMKEMSSIIDTYGDSRNYNNILDEFKKKNEAFLRELLLVNDLVETIEATIKNFDGRNLTRSDVQMLYSYNNILSHWKTFYEEFQTGLKKELAGITNPSMLSNIVSTISNKIDNAQNIINDMYLDISTDVIYDQMVPLYFRANQEMDQRMIDLSSASDEIKEDEYVRFYGMNKTEHDYYMRLVNMMVNNPRRIFSQSDMQEFIRLRTKAEKGLIRSKGEIKLMLKGLLGDARYMNSKFEGYMYSTDPVVGGFAMFHKQEMDKAHQRTLGRYHQLVHDIAPEMEELGISKTKIGALGKKMLFRDKVLKRKTVQDENGVSHIEYEEVDVWTFKNPFKNYRAKEERLRVEMDKARTDWVFNKGDMNLKKEYLMKKLEYDRFRALYMNQEYNTQYYLDRLAIYDYPQGAEALQEVDDLRNQIDDIEDSIEEDPIYPQDFVDNQNAEYEIAQLKFRISRLSSVYNLDGTMKTGDALLRAKALRDHNQRMAKYYQRTTDYKKFNDDFLQFRNMLINREGIAEGSDEYKARVKEWQNTYMEYGYSEDVRNEIESLRKIISNGLASSPRVQEQYDKISSLMAGYRNSFGVFDFSMLSDKDATIVQIRDLENELIEIRNQEPADIPQEVIDALNRLEDLISNVPSEDYLNELAEVLRIEGITQEQAKAIFEVDGATEQELLVAIANKIVRFEDSSDDSYLSGDWLFYSDFENFMSNHTVFKKWYEDRHTFESKVTDDGVEITKRKRIKCYSTERANSEDSVNVCKIADPATGVVVEELAGVPGKNYQHSSIKDEYVNEETVGVTINNKGQWLPKSREQLDAINSPYYIDANGVNQKYQFINEEYEQMDQSSAEFRLLQKLIANHLNIQESASKSKRLYLDAPRFKSETAEVIAQATDNGLTETINTFFRRFKQFFQGSPDDFENGVSNFNSSNDMDINEQLVNLDTTQDTLASIPVSGLYDLDANDVSTNILRTMMRYAESVDKERAMREESPIVKAIQTTLNNENNFVKDNKIKKSTFINNGLIEWINKKDKTGKDAEYLRREAINNLIEREFNGITMKGMGSNSPVLQKISNLLMGFASFSFFGMNIPSALKNSYGIKFQALLEGVTGKYMDLSSLEKGNRWSYKMMSMESLGGFYNMEDGKSLERQVVELFDMHQDSAADKFMDPMWRSLGTDLLELKPLYAPREWVEHQATYQVGAGILYFNRVLITNQDGSREYIPYMDAFQLNSDGILEVKDGVSVKFRLNNTTYIPHAGDTVESIMEKMSLDKDSNYDKDYMERMLNGRTIQDILNAIALEDQRYQDALYDLQMKYSNGANMNDYTTDLQIIEQEHMNNIERNSIVFKNEGYIATKNSIHQVNNDLGGSYAKYDQPEMQRYFLYRITMYLRRYITNMFLKRYRIRERLNPGTGRSSKGFYIQSLQSLLKIIKTKGEYSKFMSKDEKKSVVQFFTEIGLLMLIPLLLSLVFGYDDDEKDRYKKLRKMSGALPNPFTKDDPSRKFNLLGWSELQIMHLLMQIGAENQQWNPFCGGIKGMSSLTDIKSVALGPTTDVWTQIIYDCINLVQDDPSAYYSRNIGPYAWQQKKSPKVFNHSVKMLGLTGTFLDPALAIQNFEANASKVRR